MTVLARRRIYWGLFISACACLAAYCYVYVAVISGTTAPAYLAKAGAIGVFRIGGFSLPSYRLAAIGIGFCALYAALGLGYILYSFRKTVSTEVFFFAFWVLSLGLEVLRLGSFAAASAPIYWQLALAKALQFARCAGYLSLFASGLYAVGFHNEKLGTVAAGVLAIALGLAVAMPIDTGAFAQTLELRSGYASYEAGLAAVLALVTVANFLFAVRAKGERSYGIIALGAAFMLVGQWLLASSWQPAALVGGFVLLVAGSWLFVSRLHAYYLWQ